MDKIPMNGTHGRARTIANGTKTNVEVTIVVAELIGKSVWSPAIFNVVVDEMKEHALCLLKENSFIVDDLSECVQIKNGKNSGKRNRLRSYGEGDQPPAPTVMF